MFGSPNYSGYGYNCMPNMSQTVPQQQQQTNNISVVLIRGGDATADAYLMAPNQTVVLVDNEAGTVYIKETNGSGMPITNRKFKEEKASVQPVQADFITRDEFERRIAELTNVSKSQSIPAV